MRARAQYIFDNRGGVVEGRNFTQWFIDEYMVTNETLLHKNPTTGKPQVIGHPPTVGETARCPTAPHSHLNIE